MMAGLKSIDCPLFKEIRGRGLFIGVEVNGDAKVDGNKFAKIIAKHGLLTKATHDSTIRLTPPLVITESEVDEVVEIVANASKDLVQLNE